MIPSRVQVPHQCFISLFILSHHPVQTGRTPEVHQSPVDSPYLPAPGRLNQGINQTFKRQNLYWVRSCKLRDCKLKLRHCCFFVVFFCKKQNHHSLLVCPAAPAGDKSSTLPFVVAVWLLPTFSCSLGISFWTQKQMSDSRSQVLWQRGFCSRVTRRQSGSE